METKNEIRTVYSKTDDMTFILIETYVYDELLSIKCVGMYFGEPNDEYTNMYIGKLEAYF